MSNISSVRVLELTTSFPRFKNDNVGVFIYKKTKTLNRIGIMNHILAPRDINSKKEEFIDNIKIHRFSYFWPQKFQRLTYGNGIPENIKKFPIAKFQIPFLIFMFFIKTLQFGKKYNIIHANWSFAGIGGLFAARILNKPFILTMHGAEIFKLGYNPIINYMLNNTKTLIVNSNFTKNIIQTAYNLKNTKIEVIPFGCDINEFKTENNSIDFYHRKHNIPLQNKIIFTLGRLVERKGQIYLIQAFQLLNQKNVSLIISGKGPMKETLIQVANDNRNIHFIDYISPQDLPFYFSNATMFVLPAIIDKDGDAEGLGVVNIEALSYRTPVISTNTGGITDIIKNEKTGLLVEQKNPDQLAEAIKRLLDDEELRQKLITNGYQYAKENFTWDVIGKKYISEYDQLIKNRV